MPPTTTLTTGIVDRAVGDVPPLGTGVLRSRSIDAGEAHRLAIEIEGGSHPGWVGMEGVLDVTHGGDTATLHLTDDADDQPLLDAARAAGRVRRFAPVLPSLSDLYREVSA